MKGEGREERRRTYTTNKLTKVTSNDNNPREWGHRLLFRTGQEEGLVEFLVGEDGLHHEADRGGIGDVCGSGAAAAAGEKATETTGAVHDGRARVTSRK
jgi:hypothetical protein